MTQNDDGSVFRFTGCAAFGGHHNAYRVCGTKGQIENLRGMGGKVMLRYNKWEKPDDMGERFGVRNLRFGNVVTDILADGSFCRVQANAPYTLKINGKPYEIAAGDNVLAL